MTSRGVAVLLLSAAVATSGRAAADVALIPAADGQLGAWLVKGPLPKTRAIEQADRASVHDRYRVVHARDGAIDLDRALAAGQKAGATALLGGTLELEHDLDGVLLASIDGAARLLVDGRQVWEKTARSLRGGGWDTIPLTLPRGSHSLLLWLEHPGTWWALELRLLDARRLLPPTGARLVLAGTTDSDGERLTRALVGVRLEPGAGPEGFTPRLAVTFPRGAPLAAPVPIRARVSAGGVHHELSLGQLPLGPAGVVPFEATLPRLDPAALGSAPSLEVELRLGALTQKLTAALSVTAPPLLARADQARAGLAARREPLVDVASVAATLESEADAVARAAPGAEARLGELLAELDAGRDPLGRPGLVTFARRALVDGEPDPTLLHIPARYVPKGDQRFPLVVVLHGLNGTPRSIMEAFLDSKARTPSVDGFVLAPHAHGNAFYRGPGELEVMAAVKWALDTYPIDPARVSISGVSMGGTGTGHLGLWYADRFSAAAPLCGYHSYFVRRDTKGRPLRPWETERMHHWSPASFAERGRNLPLWVAHGTKDFPLENSRVLVDWYRALGYAMTDEWPDTGHDVWTKAYAGARLFPWLARARLDPGKAHVTVKTDSLRFGKLHWVAVQALSTPGKAGTLDADASVSPVRVKTDGIDAFELERGPRLPKSGAVQIEVDGALLSFADGEPVRAKKHAGGWAKGAAEPRGKRAGLEGPIRDVFLEPLVFSFGTGDPRTTRANREVATALSRRHGPEVGYRVVADTELDEATLKNHSVVAVGTRRDHALLTQIAAKLPIRDDGTALVAGPHRFASPGTGAIFIHPNPAAPTRYVVVVTAVDAAGIWRALSLPQLLPDFLIYDDHLGPAAAEIVLGRDARALAGGFFGWDWQLPAEIADPEAGPR